MNRAQKNCNPVNLRYAEQKESTGKDDLGFAIFPDAPAGFRAAHRQIRLDQTRSHTIKSFITKFAPSNENDTARYVEVVCKEMNVQPDTALLSVSEYALAGVLAMHEGFFNV